MMTHSLTLGVQGQQYQHRTATVGESSTNMVVNSAVDPVSAGRGGPEVG